MSNCMDRYKADNRDLPYAKKFDVKLVCFRDKMIYIGWMINVSEERKLFSQLYVFINYWFI